MTSGKTVPSDRRSGSGWLDKEAELVQMQIVRDDEEAGPSVGRMKRPRHPSRQNGPLASYSWTDHPCPWPAGVDTRSWGTFARAPSSSPSQGAPSAASRLRSNSSTAG